MQSISSHRSSIQPARQGPREHPVRLLALRVRGRCVVAPPRKIHVVEFESIGHHGRRIDHARSRGVSQQPEKLGGQQVISKHVRREGEFNAVRTLLPLGRGRAGVIDEYVQHVMFLRKGLRRGSDRTLARKVHDEQLNVGIANFFRNGFSRGFTLYLVAASENNTKAATRKSSRDLKSNPGSGPSHQAQGAIVFGILRGGWQCSHSCWTGTLLPICPQEILPAQLEYVKPDPQQANLK